MIKDNEKEMFPLVLENGDIIGSISRNEWEWKQFICYLQSRTTTS